jgi:hypothetical protein
VAAKPIRIGFQRSSLSSARMSKVYCRSRNGSLPIVCEYDVWLRGEPINGADRTSLQYTR